jgi:hypothetical protein
MEVMPLDPRLRHLPSKRCSTRGVRRPRSKRCCGRCRTPSRLERTRTGPTQRLRRIHTYRPSLSFQKLAWPVLRIQPFPQNACRCRQWGRPPTRVGEPDSEPQRLRPRTLLRLQSRRSQWRKTSSIGYSRSTGVLRIQPFPQNTCRCRQWGQLQNMI